MTFSESLTRDRSNTFRDYYRSERTTSIETIFSNGGEPLGKSDGSEGGTTNEATVREIANAFWNYYRRKTTTTKARTSKGSNTFGKSN